MADLAGTEKLKKTQKSPKNPPYARPDCKEDTDRDPKSVRR